MNRQRDTRKRAARIQEGAISRYLQHRSPCDPRAWLDWLCAGHAAYRRHRLRCRSRRYRIRRGWCKNLWIGAGLVMLAQPIIGVIAIVSLFTTLLSFAILDESDGT